MLHRTQLLLEPEQHEGLSEIARREGRSISEVVRGLVQKEIERRNSERALARERGLEAIRRIREIAAAAPRSARHFDVVDELNRMREERDEEIWASRP